MTSIGTPMWRLHFRDKWTWSGTSTLRPRTRIREVAFRFVPLVKLVSKMDCNEPIIQKIVSRVDYNIHWSWIYDVSIMMCILCPSPYIDESQRSLKCSSSSKNLMLTLDRYTFTAKDPKYQNFDNAARRYDRKIPVLSRLDRRIALTCTSWQLSKTGISFFPNATVWRAV